MKTLTEFLEWCKLHPALHFIQIAPDWSCFKYLRQFHYWREALRRNIHPAYPINTTTQALLCYELGCKIYGDVSQLNADLTQYFDDNI